MATSDGPIHLGTFTLPPFPKPTPLERAERAIAGLSINRPDLAAIMYFGGSGKLTPDEVVENARRKALYKKERLEIIAKYGVEEHFLELQRAKVDRLLKKVIAANKEIGDLQAIATARRTNSQA